LIQLIGVRTWNKTEIQIRVRVRKRVTVEVRVILALLPPPQAPLYRSNLNISNI
jgi:hypothetical protein